ncbi:MAG: hypothetical protein ABIJ31_08055 [Pseudomonadota bacterium]
MIGQSKRSTFLYSITIALLMVSGFGQMPIFKRYYIADLPGLSWLAKFYVTHVIHYSAAVMLIFLAVYFLLDRALNKRSSITLTVWGKFGIGSLWGLIVSGAFMVIKNLSGIYFAHTAIIVLDIVHICFCMVLMGIIGITLITRKKWVRLHPSVRVQTA